MVFGKLKREIKELKEEIARLKENEAIAIQQLSTDIGKLASRVSSLEVVGAEEKDKESERSFFAKYTTMR